MNSQVTPPPAKDFKRAVALQFASRPALRTLVAQKVLQFFVERHPNLATVHPPLNDAEPLKLMVPTAKYTFTQVSLMDSIMQAMLDAEPLDLEKTHDAFHGLTFPEPYHFNGSDGFEYIELKDIAQAFDELQQELLYHFQQAQLDYWQGKSSFGVSRDRWLQQTLKSALLQNLPLQDLDAQQQACVYGLLKGGRQRPNVFVVEVQLESEGQSYSRMLPNLLLHGEWDERTVVLWCSPSSVVKSFDTFDEFAFALSREMGEKYRFESMRWNRYELEGDAFAQQSALLLDAMLQSMLHLRASQVANVEEMALLYAALSDPSQWFIEGYTHVSTANITLPPGVIGASAADSFAYQCALFELALAQAEYKEAEAPEEVLDLHSYASQRLRAQLLADHPVDANYFPDDLNLKFIYAEANPGGAGAGVGGGVIETKNMTLTEFAIGNLSSLNGAVLHAIEHRTGQLIMDWMNVDYIKTLVAKVDIGGHYPTYVADMLDDPLTRVQRVTDFARQWRCSLLFSALSAKLAGTLTEAGLQCVVDFYHGDVDQQTPSVMLAPLAFEREPSASQSDVVSGMYVFFPDDAVRVLLYRPLYASNTLMEFTSIDAMMAAITEAGPLQDSILEWLPSEARLVYDRGGFREPHLRRPIVDTSILPEPVKPASLDMQFWKIDVDAKLYKANRDLLVELGDRQSVSNTESRWALLVQGAWLLFNVVTLTLRGPVATFTWLTQAIHGLKGDIAALENGSESEKTAAVIDLILNVGMTLLQVRLPQVEPPAVGHLPTASELTGGALQGPGFASINLVPEQGKLGLTGSLATREGMQLDFSWRGGNGINQLPGQQRQTLRAMRSGVALDGLQTLESGAARGLYQVDDRYYAKLASSIYRVEVSAQGVRVLGAKGEQGPWLLREGRQWRVDAGLRLLGGGPKRRADKVREENLEGFDELDAKQQALAEQSEETTEAFTQSEKEWTRLKGHVAELKKQLDKIDDHAVGGARLRFAFNRKIALAEADALTARYAYIESLKQVIVENLKHDQALADMVQPKFARHKSMTDIKEKRSTVRYKLINKVRDYYNEIVRVIDHVKSVMNIDEMDFTPVDVRGAGTYFFINSLIERIVRMREDLAWVSNHLDRLLSDTKNDSEIVFPPQPGEVKQSKSSQLNELIEQRQLTGNDIQLNLLHDLARLCIDRAVGEDSESMQQYYSKLWNPDLNSAGTAHGALAAIHMSVSDEMGVLADALDEYKATQANAALLEEIGGAVINSESLSKYQSVLDALVAGAEVDLAKAIRESESIDSMIARPNLYKSRKGKYHVAKTRKGHRVIGEESTVDGKTVLQQKSTEGGEVLRTFGDETGQWQERVAQLPDPSPPVSNSLDIGTARAHVRKALGEVESVIKLAGRYIGNKEPIGMRSVIEGQVEQLQAASRALGAAGIASEFETQVSDAIKRLNDTQAELLSNYYLTTDHPTAASLRFLFNEQKISIKRTVTRKALAESDYLDVYEVRRVPSRANEQGKAIWEAHFHYENAAVPARKFAKGHLKTWSQRLIGRRAQMEAAGGNTRELLEIHRGNLALSDVEGIIPFD